MATLKLSISDTHTEPNKWKIRHQSALSKSLVPFHFFLNVTLVRDVVKISIVGEINDLVCIVVKAYQTQMDGYVG